MIYLSWIAISHVKAPFICIDLPLSSQYTVWDNVYEQTDCDQIKLFVCMMFNCHYDKAIIKSLHPQQILISQLEVEAGPP